MFIIILLTFPVEKIVPPKKRKSDSRQLSLHNEIKTPKEAFRNIRNYLAGQFVGATRDDALLDEVLKCLFCKLVLENGEKQPLDVSLDSFDLAKNVRSVFGLVKAKFPEIYSPDSEILLDPTTLRYAMMQLDFSIMDAESDPIGDAFEIFIGSESRGNAGQFFTPRTVSKLLVESLDPQQGETILDPACGAGGFLASVCAHFARKGIKINSLRENVSKNFYGIDKDSYLAQLCKVHITLLTGGRPNIIHGDSIALQNGQKGLREQLPKGGVDVLLTNPPFGVKIVAASPEILQKFELAKRWVKDPRTGTLGPSNIMQSNVPPQVLFVERCLSLLKVGGRLGMVLPESILSNKSYRHVVEYLMKHADVMAVLGMPEALFKTSGKGGTHTKTCLIVATKTAIKEKDKSSSIFMAEAKWCGQDSRARIIPLNDLPPITKNFIAYKANNLKKMSNLGFVLDKDKVRNGVLCPRYYDPQAGLELKKLEKSHALLPLGRLVEEKVLQIDTGDEIGKLVYGTGSIPFIRTSDISNWELKADPKHGVSREIYEQLRKKQDVKPGDILMVKDGTYLIGTCAIVSEADQEMIYQSHLYKIRVNENRYGLNQYLILALLSSPVVQQQIRSKQFTQDIIDSLGERINELILPIPKSKQVCERITNLVKEAVNKRIEARELAKEARACVASLETPF
jgi:type I restriction enzyme M protein